MRVFYFSEIATWAFRLLDTSTIFYSDHVEIK
jgi:hypothetical protein